MGMVTLFVRLPRRLLAVLALLAFAASSASAQYILRDDATGGDCVPGGIGAWSPATKSCKLIVDVQGTLELAADNLKLAGAGHTLTPRPGDVTAIVARGRAGTSIEDLTLRGFGTGIHVNGGSGNRILKVTAIAGAAVPRPPACGIRLESTSGNEVADSVVESNAEVGICLEDAKRNRIHDNRVRFNHDWDILLSNSHENTLTRNAVVGGPGLQSPGIQLFASHDNLIGANAIDDHVLGAIELFSSDRNRIFFNVLQRNVGFGVLINWSSDTIVACNDSTDNQLGVDVTAGALRNSVWMNNYFGTESARDLAGRPAGNVFEQPPPRGGNHWNINAPFCVDANGDGFCDAPYPFIGNSDNLPWVNPVPWRLMPELCFGPPAPRPPPSSVPPIPPLPPIEAATFYESLALYRDLSTALRTGDVTPLAPRVSAAALLLDGEKLVRGKAEVLEALSGRASCPTGTGRVRPIALPNAQNDFTLHLRIDLCNGPALHLVARVEKSPDSSRSWQLRRLLLEAEPTP